MLPLAHGEKSPALQRCKHLAGSSLARRLGLLALTVFSLITLFSFFFSSSAEKLEGRRGVLHSKIGGLPLHPDLGNEVRAHHGKAKHCNHSHAIHSYYKQTRMINCWNRGNLQEIRG
jgi:hypothetical protein